MERFFLSYGLFNSLKYSTALVFGRFPNPCLSRLRGNDVIPAKAGIAGAKVGVLLVPNALNGLHGSTKNGTAPFTIGQG
ncbi:MAG: hypothetical protein QME64_02210 [bacterium]|nr:hypothetical protein [bacterium]